MSLPALECKYVTEDCIREWKNGNNSFKPPAPAPLLRYLYELIWNIVSFIIHNYHLSLYLSMYVLLLIIHLCFVIIRLEESYRFRSAN